ncbi:MAG TPA: hypothetical protein RMH99_18150 [Sandaracinaceae bacterium LLY-WYZ-13_1]|nr:hypothetical protein [Sandaracinaceae bacterium LLY-WYZ-13_1]
MSGPRQEPEGLRPASLAKVVAFVLAMGAAGVALAVWLTPGVFLEASPGRGTRDPGAPLAGIERGPFDEAAGERERRRGREALERWGWADRDAGMARIPVERAMELVADGVRPPGAPAKGGE